MSTVTARLAELLIARALRTPYTHLPGYMERFWLIPFGAVPGDLFAARVHHILRSDDDRAFHDHPWPYCTVILKGGYTEVTPHWNRSGFYTGERRCWYSQGSILFRRARHLHRLELLPELDTWTLFISGRKVQSWGFVPNPESKIYWRQYLNEWDVAEDER